MTTSSDSYFHRLSIGETLTRVAFLYWNSAQARTFIKLACLAVVPCTALATIVVQYISTHLLVDTSNPTAFQNWAALCE